MYITRIPGEKLWNTWIKHASPFHAKKKAYKKILRKSFEKGGNKNIIKVGDHAKCPECNRMGHVVWVSKDGSTAGIQCPANHRQTSRPASKFGALTRPRSKNSRNMVFITEVEWSLSYIFVKSVDVYVRKKLPTFQQDENNRWLKKTWELLSESSQILLEILIFCVQNFEKTFISKVPSLDVKKRRNRRASSERCTSQGSSI